MSTPIAHNQIRQVLLDLLAIHPMFGADIPASEGGGRAIQKDRLRTALDMPASPEGHALTEHLLVHLQEQPLLCERFLRTITSPRDGQVFHYPDFASLREILDHQNNPVDGTQYSGYSSRVGVFVSDDDQYLQLSFPYKDAMLLGQQDAEQEATGDESFYNLAIHRPEIDRLLRPKLLVNALRLGAELPQNGQPWGGEPLFVHDEDGRCRPAHNMVIKGNNLLSLYTLMGDPQGQAPNSLRGQVDAIYIDPPYYFRENKSIDSFGYNSNFKLASWLAFMRDRLIAARDLLHHNGFIAISMNEDGQEYLKTLSNDVFGSDNFVSTFIWQKKKGGGNDATHVAVEHEYIFVYAANISSMVPMGEMYSEKYLSRYSEKDDTGRYYWDTFRRRSGKQYYAIKCPDGTVLEKDPNGEPISWLRSEKRFLDDLEKGEARFVKKDNGAWSVQFKQRLPQTKTPRSLVLNMGTTASAVKEIEKLFGRAVFKTPKPTDLVSFLVGLHPEKDATILDFFGGSGTTGHAVMALNKQDGGTRKFILCEQMDYARTLTAERLRLAIEQEGYQETLLYCEMKRHPARTHVAAATDVEDLVAAVRQHWSAGAFPFAPSLEWLEEQIRGMENGTITPPTRTASARVDRRSRNGLDGLGLAKRAVLELYYDQNIEYTAYADLERNATGQWSACGVDVDATDVAFNEAFHGRLISDEDRSTVTACVKEDPQ